jgi:KDO2-lipid IV(A) lauroyltransferase
MSNVCYYIVLALVWLFSLPPLWLLYRLSDGLYLVVYYVVRYRRPLVRKNLSTSFPDKGEAEIAKIERDYYHWFCDYLVETLKMFSMSEKQMRRRMRFEGMDEVNAILSQGRSVTVYLGHYCNWEWISSLPLHLKGNCMPAQLYHPLENRLADRLFLYSRGRFHAHSIEMKEAFKILAAWKKEGRTSITGYISDQVPGFSSMHYWPTFLNHETPTYTGAERIARVLDTTVYYFDIYRPRRGYYVARPVKMCDDPKDEPKFSLTEKYYRLLEQSIQRAPAFWLWSHNRWKRTREEFNALYPEEERKRILSKL